jgi:CheY-like chemotaxis protein
LARPVEILLVEDNPGDVRLTREALNGGKVLNELMVVRDGEEALDYLYSRGKYKNCKSPDLILLDLNLPKIDGREVLSIIKNDRALAQIPVCVMTTSQAQEDILKSYNLHANCYVTKPIDIDQFLNAIKMIEHFWLTIVKLPPRQGDG